ncbi:protein translocase subunit SecD [Candidatus Blastococcus massiliensis]|uniref:protein translocase subunit SecD n=1 Tax=Candidatus Blastococcus massiliensis TaxID=1470358 RepID=UPI0004BA521C|nr:protein translocase subunit SecD [Candidatus Blastococcus massiliensis]
MAHRSLPAGRYFGAFILIVAVLYGLIYFTGTQRTPQLGLDLRGGTTVTLTARTPDGGAPAGEDLELARRIIEQRVNGLGVAEAEVVTEGDSNIVISVPGDDGDQARQLGETAQLRFRPVLNVADAAQGPAEEAEPTEGAEPTDGAEPTEGAEPTDTAQPEGDEAEGDEAEETPARDPNSPPISQEEAQAAFDALTCGTGPTSDAGRPDDHVAACGVDGTLKYLLGPTVVEGTSVTDASAGTRAGTGEWVVNLEFDNAGSSAWGEYTAANVGSLAAIVLDGRVISAPEIRGAIVGGGTEITGNFDQESATELANQLKYGALPLSFEQATAQSISTELGEEQLRAGLLAGALGIGLVFLYSLLYYRALGLVMIASLILSGVVVYGCLVLLGREIGFTLSLAGIAGFIVALGITADSFVVYFERLKDEIREGRSLRSAVPRAWVRARRTILSADAVSFLAAVILYVLAIGDVKGFAFTLGMSTVLDLVVVFLFTHPLMAVLSRYKWFGSGRISGLGQVNRSGRPPASRPVRGLVGAGAGATAQNRSSS